MKRLVLMIIPALICGMAFTFTSCDKRDELPPTEEQNEALLETFGKNNHFSQWIPSEEFLGVCTDDLCMYYCQVWKELFLEKTGYTESYFNKHITVHGSGLEHYSAPWSDFTQFYVTYTIQVDWTFIYNIDVLVVKFGENYIHSNPDLIDCYLSKEDIKKMPLYDFNIVKIYTIIETNDCILSNHERLKFSSLNSAITYLNGKTRIDKYDSFWYETYIDLKTGDWMLRVYATTGECPELYFTSVRLNLITGKTSIDGQGKDNCCLFCE